jgi:glycosyltransferase involved in cell wall biosynthesis
MKAKTTKLPSLSIGIPSYELGESLVTTLQNIYTLVPGTTVKEIILISDGRKVPSQLRKQIRHPKLKIIEGSRRQGQSQRINDICQHFSSDYLILTNDDVILDRQALKRLSTALKRPADLYTTTVRELPVHSTFEKIISMGVYMSQLISKLHDSYQNYLSCNGRLLVLSKSLAKQVRIPKKLWNNDAFIYLFSRVHGFTHKHIPEVIAYYRLPDNISEYNRQGLKFRLSQTENQRYFDQNIDSYYTLSPWLVLKALLMTFWRSPILTVLYVMTQLLVKFWNMFIRSPYKIEHTFWQTDKSTKRIKV